MDSSLFYAVAACLVMAGYVHDLLKRDIEKRILFGFHVLILVALAGFRSIGVGNDDRAYQHMFSLVPSLAACEGIWCGYGYSTFNVEYGFYLLLVILSTIDENVRLLFAVTAFLSIYLTLYAIRFFSPYFATGTLIYFSHFFLAQEMNAIRAGLAIAVTFYATTLLARRQFLAFMLAILVALSIHISIAIVIVPVVLVFFSPGPRSLAMMGILAFIIAAIFDPARVADYVSGAGFIGEKIRLYAAASQYSYRIPLLDIVNIKNMVVVVLGLVLWRRLSESYGYFQFAFYFFYSAALFRIALGGFAIIAGRGYSTIAMFEYVVFPMILAVILGRRLGFIAALIYAIAMLVLNMHLSLGWRGETSYFDDFN